MASRTRSPRAGVVERDPGWVLVLQFGRRGSALQSGTKTAQPVTLGKTSALCQKLVQEKLAKGYSPAEGGTPFQDTDKAGRITGVLPQLLNTLAEEDIEACLRDAEKRALLAELRAHGQEGIVFKRASAPYVYGRPTSGGNQLKFKFVESATLLVGAVNGSRRSVELHGLDAAGHPVALGSVTIPAHFDVPTPGAIVEVRYRYLYAYPGGSLFQPVYLGKRSDQPREARTTAQIKPKTAHKDTNGSA